MKKLFNCTLVAAVAFFMALLFPTKALTKYDFKNWTFGEGYGTATKVSDIVTNIKGETEPDGGMYVGPYSNVSTATLDEGITEELYLELDPETMTNGELFEVSLALKNKTGDYVTEAVILSQKTVNGLEVSSGVAPEFKATITEKALYTYRWEITKEETKTYLVFTVLNDTKVVGTTGKIDLDTIVTDDTKNPIANQEGVKVRYIWFCNVQVKDGINVHSTLPVKEETKEFVAEEVKFESETALPNNYVLEVEAKEEKEVEKANELVIAAYKDNKDVADATLLALYDIKFTQDSEEVEVKDGKFKISIDLDEKLQDYDTFKVVYINDEGKIEETLDAKLVEGKIVFETTHLSTYGIVGYNAAEEVVNPDTFDTTTLYTALILITVSAGAFAIIKLKREN